MIESYTDQIEKIDKEIDALHEIRDESNYNRTVIKIDQLSEKKLNLMVDDTPLEDYHFNLPYAADTYPPHIQAAINKINQNISKLKLKLVYLDKIDALSRYSIEKNIIEQIGHLLDRLDLLKL